MSRQYDSYLAEHRSNVYRGYLWILANIGEKELDDILPEIKYPEMMIQMKCHDASKDTLDEYDAYDRYFYGTGFGPAGKAPEVKRDFHEAFLKHIHRNPHHWQYWVLIHDDDESGGVDGVEPLDMPDDYILEMICDWWSFSWKKLNEGEEDGLKEIFNWYEKGKDSIRMSNKTRQKTEKLLDLIKKKLDELDDIEEIDDGIERDVDDPIGGTVVVERVEKD